MSIPTSRRDWRTWSGATRVADVEVAEPADAAEVAQLLRRAREQGRRVRPLGAGHSFSPIAAPVDLAVDLRRCADIDAVDPATDPATDSAADPAAGPAAAGGARVRVGAGIGLRALNAALDRRGLALPNLGDIDAQTLAGALATGTHGTGGRLHGLASAVTGLTLVTPDGQVRELRSGDPLFEAARINLGALGIVTHVEVRAVPAFRLRAREEPWPLPRLLEDLDGFVDSADHAEFFWFPHADVAMTRRNDRVPAGQGRPLPRWRGVLEEQLLDNSLYEVVNRVGTARPRWVPTLNRLCARLQTPRSYADVSHRVFCSVRSVRFVETEYAVPRAAAAPVLTELRRWFAATRAPVTFPLEVRFLAADDVWLSGAYGRDTAYIAAHQYWQGPRGDYFDRVEAIVAEHGGRPHWGKEHSLRMGRLLQVHPRLADFRAVRERCDPDRTLANPHLDRILGP